MQNDRIFSEMKSIQKKYSESVFELGKSKDALKKIESEKKILNEKCSKLEEEKDYIATQLKDTLEKIKLLSCENTKSQDDKKNETPENSTPNPINVTGKFRGQKEISQLKIKNNVLEARLKQAECGIDRNKRCKRRDEQAEQKDDEDFEVEKLLNHKKQKGKRLFLVRWKGFGPDADTWEPEANLNCEKILQNYLKHNDV